MSDTRQSRRASSAHSIAPKAVYEAFDPARLTQARNLAGMTKKRLGELLGVTPAAVSQYEVGANKPRPDLLPRLAELLDVPLPFFLAGRPCGRVDTAHFRSLRSTRAYQRAKAIAYVEQAWELTYALEKRVQLPWVNLPGFSGGEVDHGVDLPNDPASAARILRRQWKLGAGPVRHLVRQMEANGIIVLAPQRDPDLESVDAFSTTRLPRPLVVLTPNRSTDVYRQRFSAAHELGHLVLHGDGAPGDVTQEREADVFAAEFLTPRDSILSSLPARVDLRKLAELRRTWGVSVDSLVYRCRELGLLSDSSAGRAFQRLNALREQPGFDREPVTSFPGERPALLAQAFSLASKDGMTISGLARELAWTVPRVRELLGVDEQRPVLTLMT